MQLLHLRGADDPQVLTFLQQRTDKYIYKRQIQKELIKIMALHVLRDIAAFIQNAKFFSLMADEVTNASNKEQVVMCIRSVDESLEAYENFVGIHNVQSITADVLVATQCCE